MGTLDHGGADIAFELPRAELVPVLGLNLFHPSAALAVATSFLRGSLTIHVQVADLEFLEPDRVTVLYRLATSSLAVSDVFRFGRWDAVSPDLPAIALDGRVRGEHVVEVSGAEIQPLEIQVRLAGNAGSVANALTVTLEPGGFFSEPLIELVLWERTLRSRDDALVEEAKREMIREVEGALLEAMVYYLGLFRQPFLANSAGIPGQLASGAAFRLRGQTLHALFAYGGSAGAPATVGRSNLGAGPPPDRVAFVVSNAALLRDLFRPVLVGALAIGTTGFLPDHPCWSNGPVPGGFVLPSPSPLVRFTGTFIDSLIAGIDETGTLRVLMDIRVTFDMFTIVLRGNLPVALTVTKSRTIGAAFVLFTPGTMALVSRIDMPAWVVALNALLGGSIGLTAAAIADAVVDALPTGITGRRLGVPPPFSRSIGMPSPCLGLASTSFSTTQADAMFRSVALPGGAALDPFRDHDLIVTLA